MAIALNIPSQIEKYLSVAFFPATGNEFTLYIANDTNRLYQWNGAAYVEVSQQDAVNWGSIGGNIINQTDLQLALAGKVNVEAGKGLSTNDYTTAEKNKLAGIEAGAQVNDVDSVNGYTGAVVLSKSDVGLSNVDNTSDLNKPVSTATQTALNGKENTITAGTTSQYFRGDKTFQTLDKAAVGLGNVDNTSDANKPISTATQTALNTKQDNLGFTPVPTSRTLTINGVTQDLSADRTFTISTGITIGSTAIASGTVGRVLFEGAGNVVQESANLFWDNTNAYLNLGATGTFNTARIIFNQPRLSAINGIVWADNVASPHGFIALDRSSGEFRWSPNSGGYFPTIYSNGSEAMRISTTRNILINTTTDAGFKLDVNGDTILRRVTFITPNTITGGTEFFRVKSGNWPTSLIQGFENGVLNLGSSSGSIGFQNTNFSLPVGSYFSFNYVPQNQLNTYAFLLTANYTNAGAGGTSEGAMLRTTGSTATSVGSVTMNQIEMKPTYNNTGGTTINRGFYYNPTLTSLTNTTHWAIHTTSGRIRFENLPTSPAGLSSGDVWNNLGVLMIV